MDAKAKKALKARAHALKPRLILGNAGTTPEWFAALEIELEAAELIKVRLPVIDRNERGAVATAIAEHSGAAIVGTIGMIVILFRRRQETKS